MCGWVGAILYVGTSVRACVCPYASRVERLVSLNNMFFPHNSSSTNHRVFLKVGSKHPNYSDESAPPSQIHNPGTLQIITLVVLVLTTALVVPCTLLKLPTSHALLTFPTPRQEQSSVGRTQAPHRLVSRWPRPTVTSDKGCGYQLQRVGDLLNTLRTRESPLPTSLNLRCKARRCTAQARDTAVFPLPRLPSVVRCSMA